MRSVSVLAMAYLLSALCGAEAAGVGECRSVRGAVSTCPILDSWQTNASAEAVAAFNFDRNVSLRRTYISIQSVYNISDPTCEKKFYDTQCIYDSLKHEIFSFCNWNGERPKMCREVCTSFSMCLPENARGTTCDVLSAPSGSACVGTAGMLGMLQTTTSSTPVSKSSSTPVPTAAVSNSQARASMPPTFAVVFLTLAAWLAI